MPNAGRDTTVRKPCVNWPLPEWDTAIAPPARRASERVTANLYLRSTGVASVLTRADQPTNGYRPIENSNNYSRYIN